MRFLAGVLFLSLFSLINALYWGNSGYVITLFGGPVGEYGLIWLWIALLGITFGADYSVDGHARNPVWLVISGWWLANIGVIDLLNRINYRPLETGGDLIIGMPGLMLDFIAQSALDITSLIAIWILIRKKILNLSAWMLVFCGYLVANLAVYASGSYSIITGVNPETVGSFYDQYIYSAFTIMLIIQAMGSGGDALLQRFGSNVDLYADIRPLLRRFADRNLHLF